MSYGRYYDNYYKQLILSGQYPYPYGYANYSKIPSISNPGCLEQFYGEIGQELSCNNLYYDINLCDPTYAPIPVADPCLTQNFTIVTLVSNVPPVPIPVPAAIVPLVSSVRVLPRIKILPARLPQAVSQAFIDPNLLDPWGILVIDDVVWVANAGSGMLTGYNLVGQPLFFVNVFGPFNNLAHPTAIAYNSCLKSFIINRGPATAASMLVIATRHGTIHGYNRNIDANNSFIIVDRSKDKAIYTGIALVNRTIYVADFYNQKIDVFGPDLRRIDDFPFIDEYSSEPIPGNYAPFNIVNIGDLLFVTYAKQNPNDSQFEAFGTGCGYISVFTLTGRFVRRFASCGVLNAPLGLVLAPSYFGFPAGAIMVSNVGNGMISIFDDAGGLIGNLRDGNYNEIVIPGLRGISLNGNFLELIYWTASRNRFCDAFMGTLNTRRVV